MEELKQETKIKEDNTLYSETIAFSCNEETIKQIMYIAEKVYRSKNRSFAIRLLIEDKYNELVGSENSGNGNKFLNVGE